MCLQTNTFQLLLLIDTNIDAPRTSAVFLYNKMDWRSTGFIRAALMGECHGHHPGCSHG